MMQQVKEGLFTIPGAIVTVIHVAIAVGCLGMWVGFQVIVLGNDVAINMSMPEPSRKK